MNMREEFLEQKARIVEEANGMARALRHGLAGVLSEQVGMMIPFQCVPEAAFVDSEETRAAMWEGRAVLRVEEVPFNPKLVILERAEVHPEMIIRRAERMEVRPGEEVDLGVMARHLLVDAMLWDTVGVSASDVFPEVMMRVIRENTKGKR